jgi:hypothetical protein
MKNSKAQSPKLYLRNNDLRFFIMKRGSKCEASPLPAFAAGRGLAESNLHLFEPVQLLLW